MTGDHYMVEFAPGLMLTHYKVLSPLGEGGMGQVWRAEDSRLGREVALKVLPDDFANDPDRHARFEREARLLASLNHPNIATLYDLEHVDGQHVLVMEVVEGQGLDELINKGPVPVIEAVAIITQIADALETAHEAGIVHRDLKPANIRIRPDATVKVLDFGLAKESETGGDSASNLSLSPTITHQHHTRAGVILGTAAYMAPEQARGRQVDQRADIWALGVVLWEMLTGRQLFAADTVQDQLAAVLTREPDLEALPSSAGPRLRTALGGCLAHNPRNRWRSAADVAMLLGNEEEAVASVKTATRGSRRWVTAAIAAGAAIGGFLLAYLAITASGVHQEKTGQEAGVTRLSVVEPKLDTDSSWAISPDDRQLAYVIEEDGVTRIVIRDFEIFDPVAIEGTEGGFNPFFSPDGRWLGFFTREYLFKVPLEGGSPRTLCELRGRVRFDIWDTGSRPKGDWSNDGTIVFSTGFWRTSKVTPGLFRIASSGGEPIPLTQLNFDRAEQAHRSPSFTPDGGRVTFNVSSTGEPRVEVVDLATGERTLLIEGVTQGRFISSNILLATDAFYSRLLAFPADLNQLEIRGEAVPLVDDLSVTSSGTYTVSQLGTLVYVKGVTIGGECRLVRATFDGSIQPLPIRTGRWQQPSVSPDGRWIAIREVGDECSIWLVDPARWVLSRLTVDGDNHNPLWTPDSQRLTFGRADEEGRREIYWQRADGSQAAEALTRDGAETRFPTSWSSTGRWLLFDEGSRETDVDVWVLDRSTDSLTAVVQTDAQEGSGVFSPDDHWIAYISDESGRREVYLRGWPEAGNRLQVSDGGGRSPLWSRDGGTLYYIRELIVMAVDLGGDPPQITAPREIFRSEVAQEFVGDLDVLHDGEGFIMAELTASGAHELRVVQGFTADVERRFEAGDS